MSSGELDIIIHATEDFNKVLSSIKKLLSLDLERLKIKRTDLSGHFGNPLIYLKIRLDRKSTDQLLETIFNKLPSHDKTFLIENLDDFIHKNKLYIRLDKQQFCKGTLSLGESDSIRIVIRNITKNKLLRKVRNEDE